MSDMVSPRILVIGNDTVSVRAATDCLLRNSLHAETVNYSDALTKISSSRSFPDVVVMVLGEGGGEVETLKRLRQLHPDLNVMLLSPSGPDPQVADVIHNLGQGYLTVPFHDFELLDRLKRLVSMHGRVETPGMETLEEIGSEQYFLCASAQMKKVRLQAELLANLNVPVLIVGESGTGKEVIAQLIHKLSVRSQQLFLKVNCPALAGDLLERDIFGYERGAPADERFIKVGKFEKCERGTILLDEITEMPVNLQAKLLHVLNEKQFFRLGGQTTVEANVRILTATSVDVQKAIAERSLRKDLYYRLSAFNVFLPPLRKRHDEIPGLLRHFMQKAAAQYSREPLPLSPRLMKACLQYAWPGNVRELQNFVTRYLIMADEDAAVRELQANNRKLVSFNRSAINGIRSITGSESTSAPDLKGLLRTLKDETEVQAITKALKETNWNRKKAAVLLHISYRGILYKIRQHEITRSPAGQATVAGPVVSIGFKQKFAKAAAAATNPSANENGTNHLKRTH